MYAPPLQQVIQCLRWRHATMTEHLVAENIEIPVVCFNTGAYVTDEQIKCPDLAAHLRVMSHYFYNITIYLQMIITSRQHVYSFIALRRRRSWLNANAFMYRNAAPRYLVRVSIEVAPRRAGGLDDRNLCHLLTSGL